MTCNEELGLPPIASEDKIEEAWKKYFRTKPDCYRVLDAKENDSHCIIKQKMSKLALQYHPDKNLNGSNDSFDSKMVHINEAWRMLGNEEKRKEYNTMKKKFQEGKFHSTQPKQTVVEDEDEDGDEVEVDRVDIVEEFKKKEQLRREAENVKKKAEEESKRKEALKREREEDQKMKDIKLKEQELERQAKIEKENQLQDFLKKREIENQKHKEQMEKKLKEMEEKEAAEKKRREEEKARKEKEEREKKEKEKEKEKEDERLRQQRYPPQFPNPYGYPNTYECPSPPYQQPYPQYGPQSYSQYGHAYPNHNDFQQSNQSRGKVIYVSVKGKHILLEISLSSTFTLEKQVNDKISKSFGEQKGKLILSKSKENKGKTIQVLIKEEKDLENDDVINAEYE